MDLRPSVILPSPVAPPKVEMAFRCLGFFVDIERGCQMHGGDGVGRPLRPPEEATRRAALEVMRTYFSGEHEHLSPFRVIDHEVSGMRFQYIQPTTPTQPDQSTHEQNGTGDSPDSSMEVRGDA